MGTSEISERVIVRKGFADKLGKSVILFAIVSFVYSLFHGRFDIINLVLLIWMGGELSRNNPIAYKWGVFVFGLTATVALWNFVMIAFDIRPVEVFDEVVQPGKMALALVSLGFWGVWVGTIFVAIFIRSVKVARPFWTRRTVITVGCFFGIPLGLALCHYLTIPDFARPKAVKQEYSELLGEIRKVAMEDKNLPYRQAQWQLDLEKDDRIFNARIRRGNSSVGLKSSPSMSASQRNEHWSGTFEYKENVKRHDGKWVCIELRIHRPEG